MIPGRSRIFLISYAPSVTVSVVTVYFVYWILATFMFFWLHAKCRYITSTFVLLYDTIHIRWCVYWDNTTDQFVIKSIHSHRMPYVNGRTRHVASMNVWQHPWKDGWCKYALDAIGMKRHVASQKILSLKYSVMRPHGHLNYNYIFCESTEVVDCPWQQLWLRFSSTCSISNCFPIEESLTF